MRPYLVLIVACTCAFAGALAAQGQSDPAPEPTPATMITPADESDVTARELQRLINRYRRQTWHWQRVMGRPITLTLRSPPPDLADRVPMWRGVARRIWARAQQPPHAPAWRCIQRLEADWTDRGAPYYGGLQMDRGFQRTYGGYLLRNRGTAEHWTPLEQMWAAERSFRSGRGFYPWPNSARLCGLI
jgi:hypothetical protein